MPNFLSEKRFRKRPVQKNIREKFGKKGFGRLLPEGILSSSRTICLMAKMSTCPCGFTVISPRGDEDVKKHMSIHLKDTHPGSSMTEEEIGKTIKTV